MISEKDNIFQELYFQSPILLKELAKVNRNAICGGSTRYMRNTPAIYMLWWTGKPQLILNAINNNYNAAKPYLNKLDEAFTDNKVIPLFTGSTSNLSQRISKHMKLGASGRLLETIDGKKSANPHKTHHQLRLGIEILFPEETDPKTLILENTGLTFYLLPDNNLVMETV